MQKEIYDVVVIGGGPAGMMSAGRAAELGAKVLLIEKNPSLGKKLLITGGGRCNVTNAEFDNRKLLAKYGESAKFLFSSFSEWSVKETLEFFNKRGVPTKVENENRVFPTNNSASSILDTLISYMKEGGVTVVTSSPVAKIKSKKATITSVILENGHEVSAKSFILATGGKSYPETGSTGDGFVWLTKLGHTIIKIDSALVPINVKDSWVKELQGLTLTEIKINIIEENKKVMSEKGKILFTHFGVSGPTILNMSRKINELLSHGEVFISLDILPNFDFSSLNITLQKLLGNNSSMKVKNALSYLIPSAIVPTVLGMSEIDGEISCNSVTREERIVLMHVLKDVRMQIDSLLGPENAIVSSGGVEPREVDWKTMRSKLFSNLYFTGDILSINRPSGGYSLQLCWTTGFVAGTSATKPIQNE